MPAPTLSSVSPPIVPTVGSQTVILTGTNFTGTTGVTIGGTAATSVVVVNDTTITCITPAKTAGTASVIVTNGSGSNGANSLLTYIATTPTDIYVHLSGGRGDAFVPQWTGSFYDILVNEKSEPYRNTYQTTATAATSGISGVGGSASITFPGAVTEITGGYATSPSMTIVTSTPSDEVAGTPPHQFDKGVTWRHYLSASGLLYAFRLTMIVGFGTKPRE